jgi:hypothetical protein
MWLVLVNHELTYESAHSKPPPFQSPLISCSSTPCIFVHHSKSFNDVSKMHE